MTRKIWVLGICAGLLAATLQAAEVPRRSPEFAIRLDGGKQVLLSEQRGKVVALLFILTHCPHCQETVKLLSRLQNEYGPRGFQALATAIEDLAHMTVPDFIKRFHPDFPVGFNNRNETISYLQHPPAFRMLMPQLVLVDRQGTIRGQYTGDDPFFGANEEKNLREQIEKLLRQPAARKNARSRKAAGTGR
jgi:thiol-disulfide isomerase/thioredoxin